jgi:hypothetical protein
MKSLCSAITYLSDVHPPSLGVHQTPTAVSLLSFYNRPQFSCKICQSYVLRRKKVVIQLIEQSALRHHNPVYVESSR